MKLTLVNRKKLLEASKTTRFGPDWPGQRCLAKTRKGTPCQNPVVADRNRCRMHGGKLRRSRLSMPNCGGLLTSLSGAGLFPKGGLGSGTMGRGTRLKDHGTLISLVLLTLGSWIKERDPWCTALSSRKIVAVWRLLPPFPAILGETRLGMLATCAPSLECSTLGG